MSKKAKKLVISDLLATNAKFRDTIREAKEMFKDLEVVVDKQFTGTQWFISEEERDLYESGQAGNCASDPAFSAAIDWFLENRR